MNLIILTAGTYNDARRKAHELQPGDQLVTGQDYALSLIASGLARDAQDSPEVTAEPATEIPAVTADAAQDSPAEIPEVSAEPATEPPVTHLKRGRGK